MSRQFGPSRMTSIVDAKMAADSEQRWRVEIVGQDSFIADNIPEKQPECIPIASLSCGKRAFFFLPKSSQNATFDEEEMRKSTGSQDIHFISPAIQLQFAQSIQFSSV